MRFILNYFLLTFFLIISGLCYFFGFTTAGLQLGFSVLADYLPGKIHIQQIEGTFFSAFSLHNITYQDADIKINLQSLDFAWQPKKLWDYKIEITRIILGKIEIQLFDNTTSSFNFDPQILHALRFINFKQIYANNIIIKKANHILLQAKADIQYQNNQLQIKHSTLRFTDAEMNIDGTLTDNWNVTYHVNIPHIEQLISTAKGSLTSSGTILGKRLTPKISVAMDLRQFVMKENKIQKLTANATLFIQPEVTSNLTMDLIGLHLADYSIEKIRLTATARYRYQNKNLETETRINLNQKANAVLQFSFPEFSTHPKKIIGKMNITIPDLSVLTDFIPHIENTRGNFLATIQLAGNLQKPIINADLTINQGSVFIPALGVTLDRIHLKGNSNQLQTLQVTGSLQSGKGLATISGNTELSDPHFSTTLKIQGNNLQTINLEHYKIISSPNLTLSLSDSKIELTGTVIIPQASITPTDFSDTVTMPDDVIFVGKSQLQNSNPLANLSLQLHLILGDNIYIQYQDLQTFLTGKLQIFQTPGTLATASGELSAVKGSYHAYGKTLTIQQGRLIYTGNTLTNPGLSIRAIREIKAITTNNGMSGFANSPNFQPIYTGNQIVTVGVQIQGTLLNPLVSLYSSPPMSQSDMLSYLLFGYPQSQAGGSQLGALLSASSAMNMGGKTPSISGVTEGLQNKLGLNELTIGSTQVFDPTKGAAVATTSFIVGKQLAPNLYLHYSVGLFNPVSILNLRYQLTQRWALQSETSTIDSGADLLYGFERD
jgi:autotransporter translocation and assembly factor TamB